MRRKAAWISIRTRICRAWDNSGSIMTYLTKSYKGSSFRRPRFSRSEARNSSNFNPVRILIQMPFFLRKVGPGGIFLCAGETITHVHNNKDPYFSPPTFTSRLSNRSDRIKPTDSLPSHILDQPNQPSFQNQFFPLNPSPSLPSRTSNLTAKRR